MKPITNLYAADVITARLPMTAAARGEGVKKFSPGGNDRRGSRVRAPAKLGRG